MNSTLLPAASVDPAASINAATTAHAEPHRSALPRRNLTMLRTAAALIVWRCPLPNQPGARGCSMNCAPPMRARRARQAAHDGAVELAPEPRRMERRTVPRSPVGRQSGLPAADRGGAAARAAQDGLGHHAGLVRTLVHSHLHRAFAGVEEGEAPGKITPVSEVDATILDRFLASNEERAGWSSAPARSTSITPASRIRSSRCSVSRSAPASRSSPSTRIATCCRRNASERRCAKNRGISQRRRLDPAAAAALRPANPDPALPAAPARC